MIKIKGRIKAIGFMRVSFKSGWENIQLVWDNASATWDYWK